MTILARALAGYLARFFRFAQVFLPSEDGCELGLEKRERSGQTGFLREGYFRPAAHQGVFGKKAVSEAVRKRFGNRLRGTRFNRLWRVIACLICAGVVSGGLAACGKQVATSNLHVGDCFNASREVLVDGQQASQVETRACRRSHNSEVVGIHTVEQSANDGETQIASQTSRLCIADFEKYVGKDYQDTEWDIYPLTTITTRDHAQSREIICVALSLPERSGTLKNYYR